MVVGNPANMYCPFFVREAGKSITCEGLCERTLLTIRFETPEAKQWHIDCFCTNKSCLGCPLAQALMEGQEK